VDHLVSEEVVARNISASDRRQVMVTLTAKGRTIFEQAVDALKEHNRRALNGLSDDDLRTLRSLLQRVLMNIVSEPERFQQILKFER
jgi:DNA-binding MarR family transcriptional regulator